MSIRLEHDWIIINTINQIQLIIRAVLARLAIDQVVEHGVSVRLQPNDMRFTLGRSVF